MSKMNRLKEIIEGLRQQINQNDEEFGRDHQISKSGREYMNCLEKELAALGPTSQTQSQPQPGVSAIKTEAEAVGTERDLSCEPHPRKRPKQELLNPGIKNEPQDEEHVISEQEVETDATYPESSDSSARVLTTSSGESANSDSTVGIITTDSSED